MRQLGFAWTEREFVIRDKVQLQVDILMARETAGKISEIELRV